MKPEQFTEKALEAISEANTLAKESNSSQIDVEHLLSVLLEQEGVTVRRGRIRLRDYRWSGPRGARRPLAIAALARL